MKKEIDIRKYVQIMIKWRSIIVFNVVAITILAILISLLLPRKWTAVTTILPPAEESTSGGISALIGGGLGGLLGGGTLSRMLPGMATLSDLFAKELQSTRITEAVLRKNDLLKLYDVKLLEDGIKELRSKTSIEVSPEGIIVVAVTEKTPELAAKIANSYIEELDNFNREVNMTVGKKNRLFLEERLKQAMADLKAAEESLKIFKEKYRTVSLTGEMNAAIEAVSKIKAQIMAYEVQLGMMYKYSSRNNPEIIRLQNEIAQLKYKEKEIERTGSEEKEGFGVGASIPFEELPEISLRMVRKKRNVLVQETLYELVTQQYEQAKIMEMRDTPIVQVLDEAKPPERRSFPKRKKIVIFAVLLSCFWGIGLAFLFEYIEDLENKKPDEMKEWKRMFNIIRGDFSKLRRKRRIS